MSISRAARSRFSDNVARDNVPAQCANTISPACLQALYNIPPDPASAPQNNLFVAGFNQDIAADEDLQVNYKPSYLVIPCAEWLPSQAFLTQTRPDHPELASTTYNLISVDGVKNFTQGTEEGVSACRLQSRLEATNTVRLQSADIQYTRGVATNVPVTYVSVGGGSQLSDNLAMINFLIQLDPAPLVLTTSYGFQEDFSGANLDLAMSVYFRTAASVMSCSHPL